MKNIVAVVLSVVAFSFLSSCGVVAGAPDVAGTYKLDKQALKATIMETMPGAAPTEGPGAEAAVKMLNQLLDGFEGAIELKADNTCALTMVMMGQKKVITGTWKFEGDQLSITAKEQGEEEETRLADFGGGIITIEEEQGDKTMTMRFVRTAQ